MLPELLLLQTKATEGQDGKYVIGLQNTTQQPVLKVLPIELVEKNIKHRGTVQKMMEILET
jgi:hypothetical protein